jgi:ABC-type transport system involved in multi-copper enzyme maturation permease subunit
MTQRWTELKNAVVAAPWRLWLAQLITIVGIENQRNLFTWRSLWVYGLAFAPCGIILLHAIFDGRSANTNRHTIENDTLALGVIFQFYYLRLGIFFGTMGIFTRLIRGEMVDRSLHYWLLAPVRREVLLVGKFLAGMVRAVALFGAAVALAFFLMYMHFGVAGQRFMFDGPGFDHLKAYLVITLLACLAYGSIFLLLSMMLKNPMPAALLVMGYEALSSILPSTLQRLSVISYLRQLLPVSVPAEGIFALLTVNTDPVAPWAAVTGVLLLTAAVVTLSCYKIRSLEISYTTD